ncbi:hypothetical protein [Jiella sonneratiae]|uniref:CopG family transcriptional regulator n=1 Tax=Jiella sonneratiae TaxID=2816856 RepID=A0ABS3J9E1_9HYPH|nr:hypothetical protein [Jiella sonneratiae]MBO0906282.1 hypothetical protein [Jiella sonneratiae]
MKANATRSRTTDELTHLDAFLEGEGTREAFEAIAIKEIGAWQNEQTAGKRPKSVSVQTTRPS